MPCDTVPSSSNSSATYQCRNELTAPPEEVRDTQDDNFTTEPRESPLTKSAAMWSGVEGIFDTIVKYAETLPPVKKNSYRTLLLLVGRLPTKFVILKDQQEAIILQAAGFKILLERAQREIQKIKDGRDAGDEIKMLNGEIEKLNKRIERRDAEIDWLIEDKRDMMRLKTENKKYRDEIKNIDYQFKDVAAKFEEECKELMKKVEGLEKSQVDKDNPEADGMGEVLAGGGQSEAEGTAYGQTPSSKKRKRRLSI
jgi:hypothetical protein